MREALLSLIVERGYEKVTVQDILDRAEIGRATFYEHFRGKEDLLGSGIEQLRAHLLQEWKSDAGTGPVERLGFTLALFRHVDGHRQLYQAIVGRESGVIVERKMRRMLADLVREDLKSRKSAGQSTVSIDLAVQYVAGALWSVLTWWMDYRVPLRPEEMNRIFRQLTFPGLDATLSGKLLAG
ncbi:MAG: TetR/AcrR family transcriptional regulator [Acidobacteria bacterium]|nr:TetR/AcrR family transcriptional regulator [Acidobacteriota bacterium]